MLQNVSSNSEELRNCFKSNQDIQQQASSFEKSLNKLFFKSFKKLWAKKRKIENPEVESLLQERKLLKQEVTIQGNLAAENDLHKVEEKKLGNIVSDKNRDKYRKCLKSCQTLTFLVIH